MQEYTTRHPLMDKQSQFLMIFGGVLGLSLAILTARPKQVADAIFAVLAGLFGCLVLAPAVAGALTSFAVVYPSFGWLNASPGTAAFTAIVGLGGMLGFQIVVAVKSDFINWIKRFAIRRITPNDPTIHESES